MFRLGAVLLVLAGLNSFGWGQTSDQAAAPAQGSFQAQSLIASASRYPQMPPSK